MITVKNVKKIYDVGEEKLEALKDAV